MGRIYGRKPTQPEERGETLGSSWWPVSLSSFASVDTSGVGALQSIAVDSSIKLIASLISELPLHTYRGTGSTRTQMRTPANLADPGGTGYGLEHWVYTLLNSWLYRANAYGRELDWDPRTGRPRQIELFHPDDVTCMVVDGRPQWWVNGSLYTPPATFFHSPVDPVAGRVLGQSVIEKHIVQWQTSVSASKFGLQWFTEGTHPQAILQNTEVEINSEQAAVVLARWRAMKSGTREPAVMGRGWEFKGLGITPNESQFLETMRYSEAQCARMFGPGIAEVLGYETGGSLTYANVAERRADLLALTIDPWLNRVERILTSLLPEPQYVRYDRDALLQSTTMARYQAHELALKNRWKTVNEVREDEDMPAVEWGDEPNAATAGGNDGTAAGA